MRWGWLAIVCVMLGWLGNPAQIQAQWVDSLSEAIRSCILWSGDHEEGSLYDWEYEDEHDAGGGVFNTGEPEVEATVSTVVAHSGQFTAKATITNAVRAENGSRAVRLMRWTHSPWTAGGQFFPAEAYYSVWMYFPQLYNPNKAAPWDPGDGGWWNVFQFKDSDEFGVSQPMWSLNVEFNETLDQMEFYMFSPHNTPGSYVQSEPKPVPVQQWLHVEVFYRYSASDGEGAVVVWQDGQLIFNVQGVRTALIADSGPVWGIGNYTDHISGGEVEGTATIYFDDAIVGRRQVLSTDIVPVCSSPTEGETLPPSFPEPSTPSQSSH